MRILGLSGSLRRASHNRALLRAAATLLPDGDRLEVWDRLAELPAYDEDLDDAGAAPEPVAALRAAIAAADAVLISTPEYNASLPGALKNALDWASRPHATNPLRGKPVAVIGASSGLFGAVWAQAEVRKVLTTIGADEAFDARGALRDPAQQAALAEIVGVLADGARAPLAEAA